MLNKLLAMISAGAPGVTRLLFFVVYEFMFGLEELGNFSSGFFIAIMICFFTSTGWSLLLDVRIPPCKEDEKYKVFSGILFMCMATTFVACLVLCVLGYYYSDIMYDVAIIVFVWGGYAFFRSWLFAHREYKELLIYDLSFMALTSLSVIVAYYTSVEVGVVLLVMSVVVFWVFFHVSKVKVVLAKFEFSHKGLEFGLVNFLSSSIFLGFVPLVAYFESAELAGYVTLLGSIANIGQLIPRAIAVYQMPTLASMGLAHKEFYVKARNMLLFQVSTNFVFFLSAAVLVFWYIDFFYPIAFDNYDKDIILVCVVVYTYFSICSIPPSNVLCVAEDSIYMIYMNAAMAVTFYLLCACMLVFGFSLYAMYAFSIMIGIFRVVTLTRRARGLILNASVA